MVFRFTSKTHHMKQGSTLFLKSAILILAVATVALLLWLPQTEGRAAGRDMFSIYLDPLIILAYIGSTPFFTALYQAFKLLNLIDANKAFSQKAVNALRNIKLSALILIGFIAVAVAYVRFFANGDDPAGPTMLGILVSFASAVIATAAAVFQKLLQNAVDIKSENDLTV